MFVFFWLCFSRQVGVFGDVEPVIHPHNSVKEGDSVTLHTDTELQSGDEILWTFGTNGPLIAKTNGVTIKIADNLDERFKDRLKLDKTGSLTITNIRTEHAGLYEAEISSSSSSPKHRFNVTVYAAPTTPGQHSTSSSALRPTSRSASRSASQPASGSSGSDTLIVQISAAAAAGFLLIVAAVGIFICRKRRKTDQQVETVENREEDVTYANPTFYKRNAQTAKQEDEVVYAAVVTRR